MPSHSPPAVAKQPSESECSFRFAMEGDERGILNVLQASFPSWPGVDLAVEPIDHVRWKMASHPMALRYTPVAEHGKEIIGVRIFMVRDVLFNGTPLLAYQATDISVHPAWRERGILNRLVDVDYRGLDGRVCVETFDLKFAYQSGHPAVLRLQEAIPGIYPIGNSLVTLIRPNSAPVLEHRTAFNIREIDSFDDRLNAFWPKSAAEFDIVYSRTVDVMNWRYADPRGGSFRIAVVEDETELLGFVITRCTRGRGYIADWLALPGRLDVADALLCHALASFDRLSLQRIECWLPKRHPYQTLLRRAGFAVRESQTRLHYRPYVKTAEELEPLRDPNVRVHFTAGDTDLI